MTTIVYPKVPSAPDINTVNAMHDANAFRLTNITQMQRDMAQELTKYSKCRRRYKSVFNMLSYVNTGSAPLSTVTAGTGVGLLATGIGAPVGVALGSVSLGIGAISFITTVMSKKVVRKLEKHDAIVALTLAKLSSFRLIISKALTDTAITEEEFKRLQADYDDYKRQKFDIQSKTRNSKPVDMEAIKKEYLKKGYLLGKENEQLFTLLNLTWGKFTASLTYFTKHKKTIDFD